MKIDNFVRIIDGRLITTPPIDAFATICLEASRVSHGDLFIDTHASREHIQQALLKGAYAIVTTLAFEHEDDECAWIEVNSIEHILIKLLRYTITQKALELIVLSPVQAALLEMIQTPRTIKYLRDGLFMIAKTILAAKEEERFCLNDSALAEQIAPTAHCIDPSLGVKATTVSKGLFLSSFDYQGRYYVEQKIPALFVDELLSLLTFCDAHNISYTLEHLGFSEHCYPQFITQNLSKKEFGSSAKALIFEPLPALLSRLLPYVKRHIDPTKLILCLPKNNKDTFAFEGEIFYFETIEDLSILSQKSFQYALILGDREKFEPLFTKTLTTQLSLF